MILLLPIQRQFQELLFLLLTVWYIVDEAHENSVSEKHKKVSDHNPDYLPTNIIIPQMRTIIELKDKSAQKNDKGDLNDGIFFKDIFLRGNAVGMS
jgi:hypothetical protein